MGASLFQAQNPEITEGASCIKLRILLELTMEFGDAGWHRCIRGCLGSSQERAARGDGDLQCARRVDGTLYTPQCAPSVLFMHEPSRPLQG